MADWWVGLKVSVSTLHTEICIANVYMVYWCDTVIHYSQKHTVCLDVNLLLAVFSCRLVELSIDFHQIW